MSTNYHRVLGVSRSAGKDEIRKAYLALVRKWHPDHNKTKGAEEKFKSVSEAYEMLCDDAKRATHTFETGSNSSVSVWNDRRRAWNTSFNQQRNSANANAKQRSQSISAAANWVDMILHPYSLMILIPALFAAQWFIGSNDNSTQQHQQQEQLVPAWFNTESQRWETPAPWDKNFQLQKPVIKNVARSLVHESSSSIIKKLSRS